MAMKANDVYLFVGVMASALIFQCSGADDAADELTLPPDPVSTPGPTTGEANHEATFYPNGFADSSNARLVVDSLSGRVDPEFQYVVSWLGGNNDNGACCDYGSKVSDIFLHDDGKVYVSRLENDKFSLLNLPYGGDWTYIFQWNLEYIITDHTQQPDELVITGAGLGSYLYGDQSRYSLGIRFEFRGVQIVDTNDFYGSFTLEEKSSDERYNLSVTGTLTLERD